MLIDVLDGSTCYNCGEPGQYVIKCKISDYFRLLHLSLPFSMSRECTQPKKSRGDGGGGGLLLLPS